jgi:hypothetical protein
LQAPREYDDFVRSLQEYFSFRASSTSV